MPTKGQDSPPINLQPKSKLAQIRNISSAASQRAVSMNQSLSEALKQPLAKSALKVDSDSGGEDELHMLLEDDERFGGQENVMSQIYANDDFIQVRKEFEMQCVREAKDEFERRHFLNDMDKQLADLARWRQERDL